MRAAAVAVLAALALAAPALASEQHPTLSELESEIICPVCSTTLDQSTSPIAEKIREFIRRRIAAGDTKSEIKRKLVAQFGEKVLAAPPKHGLNLLAWFLPIGGVIGAGAVLAVLAWRWSRAREPAPAGPAGRLEPELERRVDEELARFDA